MGLSLALLGAAGVFELGLTRVQHGDFSYIWAGLRAHLEGYDPYDAVQWAAAVGKLGTQGFDSPAVYSYPPYVAAVLMPLGALSLANAWIGWTAVGATAASLALRALLGSLPPQVRFGAVFPVLLAYPTVISVINTQTTFFLFAFATLALLSQRRPGTAGAASAALLLKPHLFAVGVALFGARPRGGTYVAVLAAGVGAAAILGTAVFGFDAWTEWLAHVPLSRASEPKTATLRTALQDIFGAAGGVLALLFTGGILVSCFLRRRVSLDVRLAQWLLASLAVAPYARAYDALLVMPPLLVIAKRMHRPGLTVLLVSWGFFAGTWLFAAMSIARQSESIFGLLTLLAPLAALLMSALGGPRAMAEVRPAD